MEITVLTNSLKHVEFELVVVIGTLHINICIIYYVRLKSKITFSSLIYIQCIKSRQIEIKIGTPKTG